MSTFTPEQIRAIRDAWRAAMQNAANMPPPLYAQDPNPHDIMRALNDVEQWLDTIRYHTIKHVGCADHYLVQRTRLLHLAYESTGAIREVEALEALIAEANRLLEIRKAATK